MDRQKIIQSVFFFIAGAGMFWYIYRDLDFSELKNEIIHIHGWWIVLSVAMNLISHLVRAYRWKLLIRRINYNPKIMNLFLSNLVLAITNLIIPRGGEIARLGVVHKFEKVPFTKLLGTALVERLTDLTVLILIAIFLVFWQMKYFLQIISLPEVSIKLTANTLLIIISAILLFSGVIYVIYSKIRLKDKVKTGIRKIRKDLKIGFSTIARIEKKSVYILQTILTYVLWIFMFYVLFFAYSPLDHLSFKAAAFIFGFSALAFLVPVQAGIGAWHFLVIQCLLLFGIDNETGRIFALLAHTFTMLVYLVIGSLAIILLPLINNNSLRSVLSTNDQDLHKSDQTTVQE